MWSSQVEAQMCIDAQVLTDVLPYISDGGGALIMMLISSVLGIA